MSGSGALRRRSALAALLLALSLGGGACGGGCWRAAEPDPAPASAEAPAAAGDLSRPWVTGATAEEDAAVVVGLGPDGRRDAALVAGALIATRGVPEKRVEVLLDPARGALRRALVAASRRAGTTGLVWVYVSGAGRVVKGRRELVFQPAPPPPALPVDQEDEEAAPPEAAPPPELKPSVETMSLDKVKELAGAGGARVLLLLEVGFEGSERALAAGVADADHDPAGRIVEWRATWAGGAPERKGEHGAFTTAAVGALRGWADGELDGARDGRVTAEEAWRYVWRALTLREERRQRPAWAGVPPTEGWLLTAGQLEPAPPGDDEGGGPTLAALGLHMRRIKAGTFSPTQARGGDGLRVRLSAPFWLGETEVTRGLWDAVMGEQGSRLGACGSAGAGADQPVLCVSWRDAVDFCNRLSQREGLRPAYRLDPEGEVTWDRAADGYRLPTEAEWGFAARADTRQRYAGTDDPAQVCRFGDVADAWTAGVLPDDEAFPCDDGAPGPSPVARYRPNLWRLYDLTGNAAEWVWDLYAPLPEVGLLRDPAGPAAGTHRVLQGGSWFQGQGAARLSSRVRATPDTRRDEIGFRLARNG